MHFKQLPVSGAFHIALERHRDDRGFFARAFSEDEFREFNLPQHYPESSISFSRRAGTLRGLHYRIDGREDKLIRCVRGAAFDVVADVRPDSPTFGRWDAIELSAENRAAIFVPAGCAHGHLTLTDDTELLYAMSAKYAPSLERGIRWDDPSFAIDWPAPPLVMSAKDAKLPYLESVLALRAS